MPLTAATLADGLKTMTPADNEADAIAAFSAAWEAYFAEATVLGIAVNGGSLAGALGALEGALTGMSATGAGAASLQAGITAFWGVVATAAATIWTMVPPVPPPLGATPPAGLAGIAAALVPVFASNTSSAADLDTAATNIATAIHATQLGGIALIPPPPPPTNPGPQPIL
jgi:hypothetical protein